MRRPPIIPVALLIVSASLACVTATVGSGLDRSETALGWASFRLGMTLAEARDLARAGLDLRRIEDRCAGAGSRLVHDGQEVFLSFTRDAPDAALQSIVLRLPPDATKGEVVRDLERRFPGLRYRPDPRWPDMSEEENPKPLYSDPDLPDQAFLVGVDEGWMWISYLRCLD